MEFKTIWGTLTKETEMRLRMKKYHAISDPTDIMYELAIHESPAKDPLRIVLSASEAIELAHYINNATENMTLDMPIGDDDER